MNPAWCLSVKDAALDITPALRLRVEASAAIVDDGWTEDPEPLGELRIGRRIPPIPQHAW